MAKPLDKDLSTDAKIWMVLLTIILSFTGLILYARNVNLSRVENQASAILVAKYTNYAYSVNLEFPAGWQPARGYEYDRYEGEDGYFGIMALGAGDITIDEMVENEINHDLNPYGTTPVVKTLTVDGEEARMILPSLDQSTEMNSEAKLIVRYPAPVDIDSNLYNYLVLISHKDHIEKITESIKFIR